MPDVSILISAKDNFSEALRRMSNNTKPLTKEMEELQGKLTRINNTRASLKVDLSRAKQELTEAKRKFEELGDEGSRAEYELKQANYDAIARNIKLLGSAASEAERELQRLNGTRSKAGNRGGSGGAGDDEGGDGGDLGGGSSMMSRLGQAGAFKFIGDAFAEVGGVAIKSALGGTMAGVVSSTLSGAASGAAIGTMVGGPGVGTAVGAGIGAVVGAAQGAAQAFEKEDDAFKAYVQEKTEAAWQRQDDTLTAGKSVAAQRETDLVSFTTLFGGEDIAQGYLDQVKTMANVTPFLYSDLTAMSKTLKTFGYGVDEMIPKLTKIGDTGAALGLSTGDMNVISTALGRMKSSGKTSLEYINMLQERGIDAVGALAEARGTSKGQVYTDISKSQINGADADRILTDFMGRMYGGAMQKQSETYAGLASTMEGLDQELQNAMGEGYTTARKADMQEQISYLSGESGLKMQEAYSLIGEFKASLENTQNELQRSAMSAVMEGIAPEGYQEEAAKRLSELRSEYVLAMDKVDSTDASTKEREAARAEVGRILAEAEIMAENEYNATDGAKIALDGQLQLAQNIRDDTQTNKAYWDAGYVKGEELSKGLVKAFTNNTIDNFRKLAAGGELEGALGSYTSGEAPGRAAGGSSNGISVSSAAASGLNDVTTVSNNPGAFAKGTAKPAAFGLHFVPYDDYPAMLHYGERVLTAQQARQQDALERRARDENRLRFAPPSGLPSMQRSDAQRLTAQAWQQDTAERSGQAKDSGFAYGLGFVPQDDYPAVLHYGERVLTAQQARQQGTTDGRVVISGNNFTVRETADVERIASALVRQLRLAKAAARPS